MAKVAGALAVVALVLLALSFVEWRATPMAAATEPTLMPTTVPPTPTVSLAEYGRALFQAKGCGTCHRHDGLGVERVISMDDNPGLSLAGANGAPDLTHYQPDPAFVRSWLRDPQAIRPATEMPKLHLDDDEIEALIAFLQTNPAR
ncbi:cytochrome c family protein [Promineifilum sp.]|uniref:c-type cytochrome n=1 Tax=Promineifilum sp. TaxID=2664178 RepID=UPI0035B45A5E